MAAEEKKAKSQKKAGLRIPGNFFIKGVRSGVQEEHLDSVVAGVCHIHVARRRVHGNAYWNYKLAVAGATLPNFVMKLPPLSNTWILLLPKSATYTLPVVGFTATPRGSANWPSPEPRVPNFVMKVPVVSNTWILLLSVSATYTLPVKGFTATPVEY